jgi:D-glucosaminate-6-phosphate ammonia-lyase
MTDSIYRRFGLEPVINAAGKLTALGGTAQADEIAQAQTAAAQAHIDIDALRARAGALIAHHTGAEAATVTTGAAAGLAISVAACITGTSLERVLRIPNADGLSRRVLLQAGHDVNFGASVAQMICLGGGQPHVFGPTRCSTSRCAASPTSPHACSCNRTTACRNT